MHGLVNPADLVTKLLGQAAVPQHLESLDTWVESVRAATAPTLSMLHLDGGQPRCATHLSGWSGDA